MPEVAEQFVFKLDELSERAKQRARGRYREHGIDYNWWEHTYEDAVQAAACLGVEIATHTVKLYSGGGRQDPSIWFTGFCSQGDGAMFVGRYSYKADAVDAIAQHCSDETLKAIADELMLMQITARLSCACELRAEITSNSSHYCHSGCMAVNVTYDDGLLDPPPPEVEKSLADLLRRFADWIYSQLEQEYDYLTSDEHVDERLADDEFDEDGNLI